MSKRIDANSLAMENIRQRKTRSTCMILLVALFSIIVYMGSMFSLSLSKGLESLSDRLGADVIVVPAGYKAEIESVLLKGEPSTFYLPADTMDKLKKFDEIEKMTAQTYVATLSASCCSYPVQIIGAVATIVLSAYVYLVPHGMSGLQNEMGKPFGVCKIDTMQCHIHHTFEIATGIAVVIGLLMVFSLISTFLKKED